MVTLHCIKALVALGLGRVHLYRIVCLTRDMWAGWHRLQHALKQALNSTPSKSLPQTMND